MPEHINYVKRQIVQIVRTQIRYYVDILNFFLQLKRSTDISECNRRPSVVHDFASSILFDHNNATTNQTPQSTKNQSHACVENIQ